MPPTIHPVPRPASARDEPYGLARGIAAVERATATGLYGHADFAETPQSWMVTLAGSPYIENEVWVALRAGVDPDRANPEDVLGYGHLSFPLRENTANALLTVAVRPDARGAGIGRALWDAMVRQLRERGRTVWQTWAFSPGSGATGPDALAAASGVGAIDRRTPAVQWLLREGFALEQAERQSSLDLGDHAELRPFVEGHLAAARASAGDAYQLLGWRGPTPEALLDGMAVLRGRMSVDAPSADLDFDEQVWDAARIRTNEARNSARGLNWVTAAVRHRPTDQLAGFTDLLWPRSNSAGIWQEDTLVRSDHRGHRLGMLIKTANLLALIDANPAARRVHTWNAAENDYMLSINTTLGFRLAGLEGAWQKRL